MVFNINDQEIKSIHIGDRNITLCKYRELDEDKFINFQKHPKLIEKSERIKYDEIIKVKVIYNKLSFKSYSKFDDSITKFKNLKFDSSVNANSFVNQLNKIDSLKLTVKKENKLVGVINSPSFLIFIGGFAFSYLMLTGKTNFDTTSGTTKKKSGALILNFIIDLLGPTLTTIISVIIMLFGCFLMWKKLNNPFNINIIEQKN